MNSLLIKNASAVITCDSKDTVMEHANLLINNGVISYIGPEAQTADETLDASGYLVYPGLINTHHHLYQTFSRNLPQVQNMELFDWLTTLYEIWKIWIRMLFTQLYNRHGRTLKNRMYYLF